MKNSQLLDPFDRHTSHRILPMPKIHQITHDNQLIRKKVNFFADYFCFAAETIGVNDALELENPLSAVDKILFQITKNPTRCAAYVDSYLTHGSFQNYDDLKNFKSYKELKLLITAYKANKKPQGKGSWIQSNPRFMKVLQLYRRDLKRLMFKTALRSIISYLRCVHDIDKHKADLISQTDLIVSEFILSNHSKNDIAKIFERIITREVGIFPFPKSLKRSEEKEIFIKNRTFQQQFDGIYNLLNDGLVKNHFIFRVYGLKTKDTFSFTYNKVTFYNPKHEKLRRIIERVRAEIFLKDFLKNDEYMMIAVVKAEYESIDIATNDAVEMINRELQWINKVFTANCWLEKFSFLLTSDFVKIGWLKNAKERGYRVADHEIPMLEDNPFSFLRNVPARFKDTLLKSEPIFIEALVSKNVSTYWQYLETIIPTTHNDGKQVIDVVSHLLLLNAESHHKDKLRDYIVTAVSSMNVSADYLGITIEQQTQIERNIDNVNYEELRNSIKHPFIKHLIDEYLTSFDKPELIKRKATYERVLWDAQAQRNATIHKGIANEKSLIALNGQLPRMIFRLRWIIFESLQKKRGKDYADVVFNLKADAAVLIR
jgi:hypothetical protein